MELTLCYLSFLLSAVLALTTVVGVITTVQALCPANGENAAIYVTVNGETRNNSNVLSFDTDGNYLGDVLDLTLSARTDGVIGELLEGDLELQKLRGMIVAPDNSLWIASSKSPHSSILIFGAPQREQACLRTLKTVFAARSASNPLMKHPYSIQFSPKHDILYVSNQNSVTVTRYATGILTTTDDKSNNRGNEHERKSKKQSDRDTGKQGTPLPPVEGVENLPGAFISRSNTRGYTLHSVRGIAVNDQYVVVADIVKGEVSVFNRNNGGFEWDYVHTIRSPVQICLAGGGRSTGGDNSDDSRASRQPSVMYITTKAQGIGVFKAVLAPNGITMPLVLGDFRATSAIAGIGPGPLGSLALVDRLLIADRLANRLYFYRSDGLFLSPFGPKFGDNPEFAQISPILTKVGVEKGKHRKGQEGKNHGDGEKENEETWMEVPPFCRKLSLDGSYKLSMKCVGLGFWVVFGLPILYLLRDWIFFPTRVTDRRGLACARPRKTQ